MHLGVLIGLLLALICGVGASLSGLWKQKGAVQAADVDIRHPLASAMTLFRSKWFAIGWITAAIAWGLHIGALALAPLSLGQAVISGGLVFLGVLAERFFGFKLNLRQWIGLLVMGGALAALAATSHGEKNHSNFAIAAIVAFQVLGVGLGIALVLTYRIDRLRSRYSLLLALSAGVLFGIADVSIKAVTSGAHGLLGALGPWTLIGLLAGVVAFFASARSLQIGEAIGVIAATASAANLVGILGGIVVFGEPLGNDAPSISGRLLAFMLVVFAVGLMPAPVRAHKAVQDETANDQPELAGKGGGSRARSPAPSVS
jgi:drug/metabolite transporter (DMT)-like permease